MNDARDAAEDAARLKILLVEDDEDDYILVRDLLRRSRLRDAPLLWARDSAEAIELLERERPDVCLADYRLGGETGVAFLRRLRAAGFEQPVVLVTGNATPDVDREAIDAGAFELLDKNALTAALVERAILYGVARSRLEARLRASEQRYAQAVHGSESVVLDWTPDDDRLHVSENWRAVTCEPGTPPPATMSALLERLHPDDRGACERRLEALREGAAGSITAELRVQCSGGRVLFAELRLHATAVAAGAAPRFVGTLQDLTRRRRQEDGRRERERRALETRRLESLAVMAGGTAHDFNNLLTAIHGASQVLRVVVGADPEATRYLDMTDQTLVKLGELTQRMLLYAGRVSLDPHREDVGALLQRVRPRLEQVVAEASCGRGSLVLLPPVGELPAEVDANYLQLALEHLVRNSGEALAERGGTVRVSAAVEDDAVSVRIDDDGGGMDPRTLDRARDPFFSTRFVGRGLGLGAVEGIVRGHGGRLELRSQRGRGTEVHLRLPHADVLAAGEKSVATVLSVIDVLQSNYLAAALRRAGHDVVQAANEAEVRAAAKLAPALVVLDANHPVAELGLMVRALRAERPDVRVFLLGAPGSEFDQANDPDVEELPYLSPPFTAAAVVVFARELLAAR